MRRANTALLLLVLASPLVLIWARPAEPPPVVERPLPGVTPEAVQQFDDLEKEYEQAVAALGEQLAADDGDDAEEEHPALARQALDKKFFLRFLQVAQAHAGTVAGEQIRYYAMRRWSCRLGSKEHPKVKDALGQPLISRQVAT